MCASKSVKRNEYQRCIKSISSHDMADETIVSEFTPLNRHRHR